MDDLKLYGQDDKELDKLLEIVHSFSKAIGMEFGLDKCAKCTIKKGKKIKSPDKEIEEGKFIIDLESDTTYTYLGIEENATLEHKKLRDKAKKEYIKRLKKICRSQLSPKNKAHCKVCSQSRGWALDMVQTPCPVSTRGWVPSLF